MNPYCFRCGKLLPPVEESSRADRLPHGMPSTICGLQVKIVRCPHCIDEMRKRVVDLLDGIISGGGE